MTDFLKKADDRIMRLLRVVQQSRGNEKFIPKNTTTMAELNFNPRLRQLPPQEEMAIRAAGAPERIKQAKQEERESNAYLSVHGPEIHRARYRISHVEGGAGKARVPGSNSVVTHLGADEDGNHYFNVWGASHSNFIVGADKQIKHIPRLPGYAMDDDSTPEQDADLYRRKVKTMGLTYGAPKSHAAAVKHHPKYAELVGKTPRDIENTEHPKDFNRPSIMWTSGEDGNPRTPDSVSVRRKYGKGMNYFRYQLKDGAAHSRDLIDAKDVKDHDRVFHSIIKPHLKERGINVDKHTGTTIEDQKKMESRAHLKVIKSLAKSGGESHAFNDLHDIYNTILDEIIKRKLSAGDGLQKADEIKRPGVTFDREHFDKQKILTQGSNNPKTAKGIPGWESNILHLSPSHLAGCGTTCGAATEGCIGSCLNTSGHGGMLPKEEGIDTGNTHEARINKTRALAANPELFIHKLANEIHNANTSAKGEGNKLAMRLNGTSDIKWEQYRPKALGGKNIFEAFPDVQFYDYTKHPDRVMGNKHPNYNLTFSYSGKNESMAKRLLAAGKNVAVVFGSHGHNTADPKWLNTKMPAMWNGHRVIDGASHDLRFLDGSDNGKGQVIGLKALGDAQYDDSGFVVWNHEGAPGLGPKPMSSGDKRRSTRLRQKAMEMIKESVTRGRFSPDWSKDPTEGMAPDQAKRLSSRMDKFKNMILGAKSIVASKKKKPLERKMASMQEEKKESLIDRLKKCTNLMRSSKLAKQDGVATPPPPPPQGPPLNPAATAAFTSGLFKATQHEKGVHQTSQGSIRIGEKEGSIDGRSFAGDLARHGRADASKLHHKEKLKELKAMPRPNLTKSDPLKKDTVDIKTKQKLSPEQESAAAAKQGHQQQTRGQELWGEQKAKVATRPPLKRMGKADEPKATPKHEVTAAIQSDKPTHTYKGVAVKSLHRIKTKRGDFHTLEIMDGEHKGKRTNTYGHELEPLQKGSKWKPFMDGEA